MNNKGFTMVELLAVIAVLAILVGLATASVFGIINNARDKAAYINDTSLVETAVTYGTMLRINMDSCYNKDNISGSSNYNTITVEDCLESCPSDFIQKSGKKYIVKSNYAIDDYKNCTYMVSVSDVIKGTGISKKVVNGEVTSVNYPMFDDSKMNCDYNAFILIYKDSYDTLNAITLPSAGEDYICKSK